MITALANDSKMMALPDPVQPTRKDIVTGAECYEISGGMQMDLRSAIDYERFIVSSIYQTADRKEGIGAFLEKRDAKFKGE